MSKTDFLKRVEGKYPNEIEFHQTLNEVIDSIWDVYERDESYVSERILERLVEPDRVVQFKVEWKDDGGMLQVNRGFRIQYSNVLGPYKGGLRFHPSVNQSILKFLAFEQIFKNSLTGLPLGAGKGGSDFDPKGKSEAEVERFCRAFMQKLYPYIGYDLDVPAGDIGVGGREISFMYDEYKKLGGQHPGVLTGKSIADGGSEIRTEATGYGLVYFLDQMLKEIDQNIENKRVLISGSGNVAQYAAEKVIELGGVVLTMSDSGGTIYDENGITKEKLEFIMDLKNNKRGRISEYISQYPEAKYLDSERPWSVNADIGLPCATQNELDKNDAKKLIKGGIKIVAEGANMPSTKEAIEEMWDAEIIFGPAKACNAGGVAVSGLEMEQNAKGEHWSREEVDQKLKNIMNEIHSACVMEGTENGRIDYLKGANIAGFKRVANQILK